MLPAAKYSFLTSHSPKYPAGLLQSVAISLGCCSRFTFWDAADKPLQEGSSRITHQAVQKVAHDDG